MLIIIIGLLISSVLTQNCTITHCQLCLNTSTCDKCFDTYYLNVSTCEPCSDPNCKLCPADACSECNTDYYLQSAASLCKPCSELNCQQCTSDGNCTQCSSGYYPAPDSQSINVCTQCSSNCMTCNADNCLTCDNGYFLLQQNGVKSCQSCAINLCLTCNAEGVCLSCFNGSYVNEGRCVPCVDSHCEVCQQTAGLCLSCELGYYKSLSGETQCLACSDHGCQVCSSPTDCTTCLEGYILNGTVCSACPVSNCKYCGYGICTECIVDFYLQPQNDILSCKSCAELHCLHCSNSKVCSACLEGYWLGSNGNCSACSVQNCKECVSDVCQTCQNGHFLKDNQCRACPSEGCLTCDAEGECLDCNGDLFLVDGVCQGCSVSNCQVCTNHIVCGTCIEGNFVTLEGLCKPCSLNNCSSCQGDTGTCTQCLKGFYFKGQQCQECQIQHCELCATEGQATICSTCAEGRKWSENECVIVGKPWWYWAVLGVAGAVIVGSIIFYAYRCWLRSRLSSQTEDIPQYTQFQEIK